MSKPKLLKVSDTEYAYGELNIQWYADGECWTVDYVQNMETLYFCDTFEEAVKTAEAEEPKFSG